MPVIRSHSRLGKKQTAAHRASLRRASAAKKNKAGTKPLGKPHPRNTKSSARFSSLKSRQMTVESAKRSIWASVHDITESLIGAATLGNLATAKELFNFAGVYSLPAPEDEAAVAAATPPASVPEEVSPATEPAMVHPIDRFFNRIGVQPSTAEPEPETA